METFHHSAKLFSVILLAMLAAGCANAGTANSSGGRAQIEARVRALLTAYQADDQDAVVALVDPQNFTIYGSDASEFVQTTAELRQMMTDDFKLWQTAKFGKIQNLDIRIGRDLATAFFNVPFSAGGRPPVMVRLTTVWRKVNGAWLLTQSANAAVTTGSSAREILQHAAAPTQQ